MAPSLRGRFGRARKNQEARERALTRGEGVALSCRLRRTSARGWGPWTQAQLLLGPLPGGEARWRASDPISVGLPITHGTVDEPFVDVVDVLVRAVRFQSEAFHGMDAEIVVVVSDPSTIEIALPKAVTGPAVHRLVELLPGEASAGR